MKSSSENKILILVGHGSKTPGFAKDMEQMAQVFEAKKSFNRVICAFLEACKPSIPEAIDAAVLTKPDVIFVLPYFLLRGRHTQEDIPRIVEEARVRIGQNIKIILCSYLEFDPKLVELVEQKIKESQR